MVYTGTFYHRRNGVYIAGVALDNLLFTWLDTPVRSKLYTCDECKEIRCTIFVTYLFKDETEFKEIPKTDCVLIEMDPTRVAKWKESRAHYE